MDRKNENTDTRALLAEIAAAHRRDLLHSRVTTVALIVLALALIVSLAVLVPRVLDTLEQVHGTLSDTQELIQRATVSLDSLDQMTENISGITEELGGVVANGTETMNRALDILNAVDFEGLSSSIQKLNQLLEALSKFRLFG